MGRRVKEVLARRSPVDVPLLGDPIGVPVGWFGFAKRVDCEPAVSELFDQVRHRSVIRRHGGLPLDVSPLSDLSGGATVRIDST